MRKITTVILSLIIVATLTGCVKKDESIPTQTPAPSPIATPTEKPTAAPTATPTETPTPSEKAEITDNINSIIAIVKELTIDSVIYVYEGKEFEVLVSGVDYENCKFIDGSKIKITFDGEIKKVSDIKKYTVLKIEDVEVDDNSFITTIKLVTPDSIIFEFDGKEIEVMAGDYERITKNGIYDGMKIKVTYDGKVKKASDLKNRKLLKKNAEF